ncbi:MAG: hypothetical protein J4400_01395 [Candidatus Aenigmarchaeota archaeon]|nr:hypothetical protein [Candidatus Aenigmarchaeota archaeon]
MGKRYLTIEESAQVWPHMKWMAPLPGDSQERVAVWATTHTDPDLRARALEVLEERGYKGVEQRDGILFLGLPLYLSRAFLEAVEEIAYRLNPGTRPEKPIFQSLSDNEIPDVYVALPTKN